MGSSWNHPLGLEDGSPTPLGNPKMITDKKTKKMEKKTLREHYQAVSFENICTIYHVSYPTAENLLTACMLLC